MGGGQHDVGTVEKKCVQRQLALNTALKMGSIVAHLELVNFSLAHCRNGLALLVLTLMRWAQNREGAGWGGGGGGGGGR